MTKEFIPYDLAIIIKELGRNLGIRYYQHYSKSKKLGEETEDSVPAPLYTQVFTWLDENYDFDIWIKNLSEGVWEYAYLIDSERQKSKPYSSKEEAELACLEKVIEIAKNK